MTYETTPSGTSLYSARHPFGLSEHATSGRRAHLKGHPTNHRLGLLLVGRKTSIRPFDPVIVPPRMRNDLAHAPQQHVSRSFPPSRARRQLAQRRLWRLPHTRSRLSL